MSLAVKGNPVVSNPKQSRIDVFLKEISKLEKIPKTLSLFTIIIGTIQSFNYIKEKWWDEVPSPNFPFTDLKTISELERLNKLYDESGNRIYI